MERLYILDREGIFVQPYTTRPPKTGTVSPRAARLSSVAYALGFVSLFLLALFIAAGALGAFEFLVHELGVLFNNVVIFLFLFPPLPTTVIAMIALRLMHDVPASVPQKVRANRAMGMGIIPLSLILTVLFVIFASGGIL